MSLDAEILTVPGWYQMVLLLLFCLARRFPFFTDTDHESSSRHMKHFTCFKLHTPFRDEQNSRFSLGHCNIPSTTKSLPVTGDKSNNEPSY